MFWTYFLNFNMGYLLCDFRYFFGFNIAFLNVKVNQKSYNFLILATALPVRLLSFFYFFLNSTDREGGLFLASAPLFPSHEVEGTKVRPSTVENGVGTACHVPRSGRRRAAHATRRFCICLLYGCEH